MNRLARDVPRIGAAQEAHQPGDLLGRSPAADRWRPAGMMCGFRAGARRLDHPRRDTVDRDAMRREVMGRRAGQPGEARLGRNDVRAGGGAGMRREAADVDDRAGARGDEVRQRRAAAEIRFFC